MLGTRFNNAELSTSSEVQEAYARAADWCNSHGATIEDKGDYCVVVPLPKHVPTQAEVRKELEAAVDAWLDEEARSYGYAGVLSACTYANTGVEKFDREGDAFRRWRSAVYAECYRLLALYEAGEMEIPTADHLIEILPRLRMEEE